MIRSKSNFYDIICNLYPLVDQVLLPQKRRLIKEINRLPTGRLLELGVGTGRHCKDYGKHQVTGIDNSAGMLRTARCNGRDNITLIRMDAEKLSFKAATFDYVVISHVLAVVDNPEKVLQETHRVLKTGGKLFVLNHFTPRNPLRYLDLCFRYFSKLLRFRSVFYLHGLKVLRKFALQEEISLWPVGYFKLLIFQKC